MKTRVLVAAVMALTESACTDVRSREGLSLVVGRAGDAITLGPARMTDAESVEVSEQIYEHLLVIDPRTQKLAPALATSWESGDGKRFTFHLRKGVRFHDGEPFDADAVLFSLERQRDPHHPFHSPDFAFAGLFKDVVRIEKVDPLTVRIELRQPYAPFLADLATYPMSIVSPTAARKWGAKFPEHPVGTGPFRFVEWSHGERITLAANPDYWGGAPSLMHLDFVTVADPRQRLVKLQGGAVDVAENLAPQDLQFVALHPDLRTERVAANSVAYLAMNTRHPPFDDERVRTAVSLAIDKSAIVKLVYQGLAEVATGLLAPSMWGYLPAPVELPNPALARTLLASAKWDPKRRPTLYVPSTPRSYLPAPERVARMIAQNLHDVGIDVQLVVSDFDTHLHETSLGTHDMCLLGWTSDNGDPDNFLYTLLHSDNTKLGVARNVSFFADPELDSLLTAAVATLDQGERERFYKQAQEIVARRRPLVPIAHAQVVVARRRGVHGLYLPPTATILFHDVTVDPK